MRPARTERFSPGGRMPPMLPPQGGVVPLLRVLMRVECVLEGCVSPLWGSMGGREFLVVGDVTLASRCARSCEGRAAHEACGGAEDLFASTSYFSTVGFFTFCLGSIGVKAWRGLLSLQPFRCEER